MTPKKAETNQMNLLFVNSQPLTLPQDKQQELANALADLLLHAATGAVGPDEKGEAT